MASRHRRAQELKLPVIAGLAVVAALIAGGLTILFTSGGDSDDPSKPKGDAAAASTDPNNPLSGKKFYLDPSNPAAKQYRQYQTAGNTADAAQVKKISSQPTADWLPPDADQAREEVAALVAAASKAEQTAVLTVYNVPHRDCGQYSSGGAEDADSYRYYVDQVSAGLKGHDAVVVLEPDAIAHTLDGCLDADQTGERYELLEYAITTLKKNPDVAVYVDAGHAAWIKDLDKMVDALGKVGASSADGFALNVSNFQTTDANVEYGNQLSDALDGKHFVIDTSRNGNGPYTEESDGESWCNPPGRALGTPPTSSTGIAKVDAFLWVKQPGDSDGTCRDGAPQAGQWWPEYALQLAEATS